MDLKKVISQVLETIKKETLEVIFSKRKNIKESDVEKNETVPALWREKTKEIMINASKSWDIFNEFKNDKSLFLALEPESVAFDYINEKTLYKNVVKFGNNYKICDIGGGINDISKHTRKNDCKNGQIYIEELFNGSKCNKSIITNYNKNFTDDDEVGYDDFMILFDQVEEFKTRINKNSNDDAKRINCNIFKNFVDDDISELFKKINENCPEKWKIKVNNKSLHFFLLSNSDKYGKESNSR